MHYLVQGPETQFLITVLAVYKSYESLLFYTLEWTCRLTGFVMHTDLTLVL